MPTAVVSPELAEAAEQPAECPCGLPHAPVPMAASEQGASLADQLWFPWGLIVANPLLTLAIYLACNAVFIAVWWLVRTLVALLTLPGLFLLLVTLVIAVIRRVASLLAYPGQLSLVIREGEGNFSRLTKRRVAMFIDAGHELARALTHPNQRMRFLQAHQNFEFAMDTLLQPLMKALEVVEKQSSSLSDDKRGGEAPKFGVNSQLLLSLVHELTAIYRQEMIVPFQELLTSANASDFEVKRQRLFGATLASSIPASASKKEPDSSKKSGEDAQPILPRFLMQLQRLQNVIPLFGRPQTETRRGVTWLLKEVLCRRRQPEPDIITTLDLMRADMMVRFGGEQIWIQSSDGFRVDSMLIPPSPVSREPADAERRVVIICNPNGGLYEFHHLQMDWIPFYTSLGCHVLVYNYRGYGRNAGSPSPLDHNRDGIAIVEYLKTQRAMAKIAIHGESIGGLVATHVARKSKDVDVMIADRTFSNVPALAQRMIAGWAGTVVKVLMQWETDNCGNYLAASCAKLLCSDSGDEIIVDGASLKSGVALHLELGDNTFDLPRQHQRKGSDMGGMPVSTTSTIFPLWLASSPICRLIPGVSRNGARAVRRVSEAATRPQLGQPLTEAAVARFSHALLSIGRRAMQYTSQRDENAESSTSGTASSEAGSSPDANDVHVSIPVRRSPSSSSVTSLTPDHSMGDSEDDRMLASDGTSDTAAQDNSVSMTPNFPEELLAVIWMQLARMDGYCGQCMLQAAEIGGHDRIRAFTVSLLQWGGCLSPERRRQLSLEPFDRRGIWIVPLVIHDVHATLQQLVEEHPSIKFDLDIGFLVCMVEYLMDSLQRRWKERDTKVEQLRRQQQEERAKKQQEQSSTRQTNAPALMTRMRAAVGGKRRAIVGGTNISPSENESGEEAPLLIHSLDERVGTLLPLQCGHNKNYLDPEKDALIAFLRQVQFLPSSR